jgi:CMP-N-acetylneuraminic acid synthetase
VPVKGNSARVAQKNFRPFGSTNLWVITVNVLLSQGLIPIVSSEDIEILEQARKLGCCTHLRKNSIASENSVISDVMIDYINKSSLSGDDFLVLCQVTSPLRKVSTIVQFLKTLSTLDSEVDILMSVSRDYGDFWFESEEGVFRIRELIPALGSSRDSKSRQALLRENGVLYGFRASFLVSKKEFSAGKIVFFNCDFPEDIDINTLSDFVAAEILYNSGEFH